MKKFRITSNKEADKRVFNNQGELVATKVKIHTNGLDIDTRFKRNPTMLFQHLDDKVLGSWDNIELIGDAVFALPNFDKDTFSADIEAKVIKGSIKTASPRVKALKSYIEGDTLHVTEGLLLEVSIVSIPANIEAETVNLSMNNELIQLSNEDGSEFTYNNKNIDMNEIEKLNASIAEKNLKIENLTADKIQLGLDLKEKGESIDALTLSLETATTELEGVNAVIVNLNKDKMNSLVDSAIEAGKITAEAKEDFLDLSFDKAKSILDKINVTNKDLHEELNLNNRDNKTVIKELTNKTLEEHITDGTLQKLRADNELAYKELIGMI